MDAAEMLVMREQVANLDADVKQAEDVLLNARTLVHAQMYREHPGEKGLGSNQAERDHRLAMAELENERVQNALAVLRDKQRKLYVIRARLAGAEDLRRENELAVKVRELDAK